MRLTRAPPAGTTSSLTPPISRDVAPLIGPSRESKIRVRVEGFAARFTFTGRAVFFVPFFAFFVFFAVAFFFVAMPAFVTQIHRQMAKTAPIDANASPPAR